MVGGDEMPGLRETFGEIFRQAPLSQGPQEGEERRMMDFLTRRDGPGVVRRFPAFPVERRHPSVTGMRMYAAPRRELQAYPF
jgi:hypothetical protein